MMKHDSKRPVTLEDILRLKRAERPPAEFWDQFDRELRVKQLAALVDKRPWWRSVSLSHIVAGARRFHLPLGATAVLAVTVFSVREFQVQPVSSSVATASGDLVGHASVAVAAVADLDLSHPVMIGAADVAPATANRAGPEVSSFAPESPNVLPSQVSRVAALTGASAGLAASEDSHLDKARLGSEKFADFPVMVSVIPQQLTGPAPGFEPRVVPSRAKPVEPLAQMRVPSGSRRSNLIASATLASTTAPVLAGDRAARELSDERLFDTVSRINARGAGVLVKF